jgi:hypothetical protein
MTYSFSVSGDNAAPEDVESIFEDTVRALRAVSGNSLVSGAYDHDGTKGTYLAADVPDAPLDDTTGDTETVDDA